MARTIRARIGRSGVVLGTLAFAAALALVVGLGIGAPAPAAAQSDAISATRFSLTIDGHEIATFGELGGITAAIEPSEYWEMGEDGPRISRLPGRPQPPPSSSSVG